MITQALRFDGKVAVVTGAGGGLGRAYALLLASRGASVVVNDRGTAIDGSGSDHVPAQNVVEEIIAMGGRATANADSVATEEGARNMIKQAMDEFGSISLIVNNAGNFTDSRPFLDTTSESFESLWRVHVAGAVNVIRAAWPHLLAQRYGRIVNIGSHGGYYGHGGKFEYAAAKGAVHGLTMTLAMEGRDHGVAVNIVAPGALTRPVRSWAAPNAFPQGSFGAELVAPTVAWLLHEDCTANGESFSVMAGNTSRIVVCETKGHQSLHPSIESICEEFAAIRQIVPGMSTNLLFPTAAIARGTELTRQFNQLAELGGVDPP